VLAGVHRNAATVYYAAEYWDEPHFVLQRLAESLGRNRISGQISAEQNRLDLLTRRLALSSPGIVVPNACFDLVSLVGLRQARPGTRIQPRLIYQGSAHIEKRFIRELIHAVEKHRADLSLELAVRGAARDERRLAAMIARTRRCAAVPFAQYPYHLARMTEADVGVMLFKNVSLNYTYCAPNKLYEYTMVGLPVLSSNQTHLRAAIEGSAFGCAIDPSDATALQEALEALTDSPTRLAEMGEAARSWYCREGDYRQWGAFALTFLSDVAAQFTARAASPASAAAPEANGVR